MTPRRPVSRVSTSRPTTSSPTTPTHATSASKAEMLRTTLPAPPSAVISLLKRSTGTGAWARSVLRHHRRSYRASRRQDDDVLFREAGDEAVRCAASKSRKPWLSVMPPSALARRRLSIGNSQCLQVRPLDKSEPLLERTAEEWPKVMCISWMRAVSVEGTTRQRSARVAIFPPYPREPPVLSPRSRAVLSARKIWGSAGRGDAERKIAWRPMARFGGRRSCQSPYGWCRGAFLVICRQRDGSD